MRTRSKSLILAIVTGGACGLLATASLAADVESRLAAGEVVVTTRAVAGCELPEAIVQAVIDAPPAAVWR